MVRVGRSLGSQFTHNHLLYGAMSDRLPLGSTQEPSGTSSGMVSASSERPDWPDSWL